MSTVPVIELVAVEIEKQLLKILKAGSYNFDIRMVKRATPSEPSAMPCAFIVWSGERVISEESLSTFGTEDTEITFEIVGYVAEYKGGQSAAIKFQRDIRRALSEDRTFGGLALLSRYLGTQIVSFDDESYGSVSTLSVSWAVRVVVDDQDAAIAR